MIVLLLFFCSGATGLVYEVIWSKYLALLFGSTIQAQTVVLAVFMGGLALGNKLFGRRADRARQPLAIYGVIEIAIGLYAFLFSFIYKAADGIFAAVGSQLLDHTGWLLLLKGALSVALLLGPTILMGGTLPLLAAWLQKHTPDAGRRSARFYSTNSLGAVCGAGLAGFFLVPRLGMPMTMGIAALVNVLIGCTAVGIARMGAAQFPAPSQGLETPTAAPGAPQAASALFRWGCVLVALTGAVSMGLEVLASRCLCLIFGASLQAFTIVLMAFILGIGFGSAVIASPRRRQWPREITTILLVLGAAAWIGLLVFNIENLVEVYRYARSGLTRTLMGYRYHQILASVFSICVLGLPAAALGSVLPLWIRVVSETSELLGDRVGRLLTWNTLGAVGGVLLTGFVLMPNIGLRGSFAALALVLSCAAVLVALAVRRRVAVLAGAVITGLLVLVSVKGGEGWRHALSAGIFRLPDEAFSPAALRERAKSVRLLFYEDAADATVSVESVKISPTVEDVVLRINGKPDATAHGDLSTQIMLGQLALMAKPDSKEVFCFGMGSGITPATALGYPIEHMTVADNCEPVLRAVKFFDPWNHGVRTNSRVRIYREDARTVLKLGAQKYDVIISEPSNAWMAGIGSVFSREFYQLAASRLKPGGIMTQWLYTYEMDDSILELVIRTMASVFPVLEIWDVSDGDIIILGSDRPWKSGPEVFRRAFALEGPRRDLAAIGLTTPEAVLARQLASQRTAFAVPGPGPIQREDFPILEYEAPRALYMFLGQHARRLEHFDERTVQMALARPEKNDALAKLDPAALNTIFISAFHSMNPDLQAYVQMRLSGRADPQQYPLLAMPCVFRDTNSEPLIFMPDSARTNAVVRQLFNAEAALQSDLTNRLQAVESIKNVLDTMQLYRRQEAGWSAAYYADLAVKAGLRLGNAAQAKAILLRAMQLEPDSEELLYLSRILVREGILQPSEVPRATGR
jgi:spermidine synthase